jgi:hypothetical protein
MAALGSVPAYFSHFLSPANKSAVTGMARLDLDWALHAAFFHDEVHLGADVCPLQKYRLDVRPVT